MPTFAELLSEDAQVRLKRATHAWRTHRQPLIVTHDLADDGGDPVLKQLRHCQLFNAEHDPVKIIFHPQFVTATNPVIRPKRGIPARPHTREAIASLLTPPGAVADAAPTAAVKAAVANLETKVGPMTEAWQKLLESDLPALNQQLKKAGFPEIKTEVEQLSR